MTTKTFVQELEERFEPAATARQSEPATLAEHISNQLMQNGLPRISPELFELERKANVALDEKQQARVSSSLQKRGFSGRMSYFSCKGEAFWTFHSKLFKKIDFTCQGNVPRFFYGLHDQKTVVYPKCLGAEVDLVIEESQEDIAGRLNRSDENGTLSLGGMLKYNPRDIKENDRGRLSTKINIHWKAPYSLDVGAHVPSVPESFIELGDEAVATYYALIRGVPKNLRNKTELKSPSIGVLWSPTNEALYCTGTIPEPKLVPRPRGDPALILDIPDGEKNYRHVVAVWDIGEELPFRNWLAEYSEGKRR